MTTETVISIGLGMAGGLLAGILATGIVPIIEIIFNYTTNIKLLELADLNQPALRELIISAPGTYHHSIIVGSLVEAAAEVTQANPLLSRVSAYYHDIGKIKKPLYFVENQKGGENKHDKLLPSMSSLILISHVKDGIEIATRNRLGKSIQDIISQHHGTSINYFFQKAKELNAGSEQTVSEKDFATQRFLERPGAIENQALWQEIVAFFGDRQSCVIATSINNEPYVTTVDFALDPVNRVMYALSEKGTRKLDQIRMNPRVAVEYHQPRDWQTKVFRCLHMRGAARTFSADDAQFDEGLRVFKPQIEVEKIKRGMDMTCFTPQEILFYDNLRKERNLNIFQLWKR